MELAELLNKKHDEARQGEAFKAIGTPLLDGKKFYIESYGCAMNFSDSEVVASILQENEFSATPDFEAADLILINTCSIREKAERETPPPLADERDQLIDGQHRIKATLAETK